MFSTSLNLRNSRTDYIFVPEGFLSFISHQASCTKSTTDQRTLPRHPTKCWSSSKTSDEQMTLPYWAKSHCYRTQLTRLEDPAIRDPEPATQTLHERCSRKEPLAYRPVSALFSPRNPRFRRLRPADTHRKEHASNIRRSFDREAAVVAHALHGGDDPNSPDPTPFANVPAKEWR